jgi:hypothetical protein
VLVHVGAATRAEPATGVLVVNMQDETFIGPARLGGLVRLRLLREAMNKTVQLTRLSQRVPSVFAISRLATAFEILDEL